VVLRIGTSGYQYRHWRGRFYPAGLPADRWLRHYAEAFDTVELNVTFYRLPAPATFSGWADAVPDDFTYAVKASRYLTHVRRLQDPGPPVAKLLDRARRLGPHLGPVLIQLPPDLRFEPDRLAATLAAFPSGIRVAVEPRHPSWFTAETRRILERHGAALCLTDRRSRPGPVWRTADWTYLRLHEGRASPRPCYGRAALAGWLDRLMGEWGRDADAHVYFNNDGLGCAIRDAAVFGRIARRSGFPATRTPDPIRVP
jgi:uncharacterized protein YecE (DUF72 family)